MAETLRPKRGGFLRPFGAAVFIRDYLMGQGSRYGAEDIDPQVGAPQTDIHAAYKTALLRAIALDQATAAEEESAARENRAISPERIEELAEGFLARIPLKFSRMRYHSFLTYFRNLKALGWVEPTGQTEPSTIQDSYPDAPARTYYRLTAAGKGVGEPEINDPVTALYGYTREQRSARRRRYQRLP